MGEFVGPAKTTQMQVMSLTHGDLFFSGAAETMCHLGFINVSLPHHVGSLPLPSDRHLVWGNSDVFAFGRVRVHPGMQSLWWTRVSVHN